MQIRVPPSPSHLGTLWKISKKQCLCSMNCYVENRRCSDCPDDHPQTWPVTTRLSRGDSCNVVEKGKVVGWWWAQFLQHGYFPWSRCEPTHSVSRSSKGQHSGKSTRIDESPELLRDCNVSNAEAKYLTGTYKRMVLFCMY